MIEPTCYDITIPKGATYDQTFTWKDDSGNIYDLSSYTARMQIRVAINAPDPAVINLTTENGGITLSGTNPNISLYISDTDTSAIKISSGFYDLELKEPDNIVIRLLQGKVKFSPEVTR
jgi:hypothetical protein